jgi:hypothetical protein
MPLKPRVGGVKGALLEQCNETNERGLERGGHSPEVFGMEESEYTEFG